MATQKEDKQIEFQYRLALKAGQKYFRMLPFVFKTFVLSIFEWPLKTGFTVCLYTLHTVNDKDGISSCVKRPLKNRQNKDLNDKL